MIKTYYKLKLVLDSPLSIGCSSSEFTDRDVITDSRGVPVVPACGLCGVYRSFFDEEEGNKIFGKIANKKIKDDTDIDSSVRIYDATLVDSCTVSVRDNVRLEKDNKTAVKGGKFDCQIVETGAVFETYIELTDSIEYIEKIEDMLASVSAGDLRFGAKTTRGFGKIKIKRCLKVSFDIKKNPDSWIDFDIFDANAWDNAEEVNLIEKNDRYLTLALMLELKDAISIREYVTDAAVGDESVPDYKQLTLKSSGASVIPASSWAGAFRARYKEFAGEEATRKLFGDDRENNISKSKIIFSESVINGGENKLFTRNSIDRFTAGTKDGALYTEITHYGGSLKLEIKAEKNSELNLNALIATILDLNNGFLSVGGLTSIGRGLFVVKKATVGAKDITQYISDNNYNELCNIVKEEMK